MISPYVRRLRLATELRTLRLNAHLTHSQLSKLSGETTPQLSRLENGHVVDQASVLRILEALNVTGDEWTRIMTIAREAGEKGWWESVRGVGARQALFANLEAGASSIREYHQALLPGLLQIPEYVRARWDTDNRLRPQEFKPDGIVNGNIHRQQMLRRPGGPSYEAILDEVAIRRLSAPPDVFQQQLYHLAQSVNGDAAQPRLLVLPIGRIIPGYAMPRCTFSIYTYPDDPAVVAVDSVTTDQVLTDPADVDSYERLYNQLRQAVYQPEEGMALIIRTAAGLTGI